MKAKDLKIGYDHNMNPVISLTLTSRSEVENLQTLADLGKPLSVEVGVYRNKRSLDANGMYWSLLAKLSEVMNISKEQLHINMLTKYGHFELIKVVKEGSEIIKRCFKFTVPYKEVTEGKWTYEIFKAYPSSAEYDTKQFSQLLQGLIDDCNEQGIPTIPNEEFERLIGEYERRHNG